MGERNQGLGHFIQELFPRVDKYLRILGNFFSIKIDLFRSIKKLL